MIKEKIEPIWDDEREDVSTRHGSGAFGSSMEPEGPRVPRSPYVPPLSFVIETEALSLLAGTFTSPGDEPGDGYDPTEDDPFLSEIED